MSRGVSRRAFLRRASIAAAGPANVLYPAQRAGHVQPEPVAPLVAGAPGAPPIITRAEWDLRETACPGQTTYDLIPELRQWVAGRLAGAAVAAPGGYRILSADGRRPTARGTSCCAKTGQSSASAAHRSPGTVRDFRVWHWHSAETPVRSGQQRSPLPERVGRGPSVWRGRAPPVVACSRCARTRGRRRRRPRCRSRPRRDS